MKANSLSKKEANVIEKDVNLRYIYPDKKSLEKVGFKFEELSIKKCLVVLPDNWSFAEVETNVYDEYKIFDEKKRLRARFRYNERCAVLSLLPRYELNVREDGDYQEIVVRGAYDNFMYVGGYCKELFSEEYYEALRKAELFMKCHYPGWEDPTKYWD